MPPTPKVPMTRRAFLDGVAAAGASALAGQAVARGDQPAGNRVSQENQRPGTRDWMIDKISIDPATKFRSPGIEGYCSATSVRAGDTIQFFVSTEPAQKFALEIFRTGYYGGDGGRSVKHLGELAGSKQVDPEIGERRLRNCQWPVAAELRIPDDWLSGVYLGKLTALESGLQSYVVFIVRDDRPADFLFQCSDHTWQAYNRWPGQFSLYDDGEHPWYWGGKSQVSFNRPYGKYCQIFDAPLSLGSGEWLLWEFPLAYWLEQHGYDVTYISNQDTHQDPAGLLRAKGFLSVGHDEYWTNEMFAHVQAAVERGVSVAFLSGNSVCGRIDCDAGSRSFRRVGIFGPQDGMKHLVGMDELKQERPYANELMGAQSTGVVTGGADWFCRQPDHWLFAGTGMKAGEGIPGLVGWEWHGDPAPIAGLEVVASGETRHAPGQAGDGFYTATIYPGPKKNFVFNASTIWWADGLAAPPGYVRPKVYTEPQGPDPRVQKITQNLLDRMRATV